MSWTDCNACGLPILSCHCGGQLTPTHTSATVSPMNTTVHVTTTEEVIMDCFRPGSEEIRYRWVCSCGKRGKGKHPTTMAALDVALDHTDPKKIKPPKVRPMSTSEKFSRGVNRLVKCDLNREEVWEMIMDLNSAMRQGIGLDGVAMDDIINSALGETDGEYEARHQSYGSRS